MTRISIAEFEELCREHAPFARLFGFRVERLEEGVAQVRLPFSNDLLRPGGTVSGPALMALADFAVYAAVLSRIGAVPLAVTTSLNINFLRRPGAADLLAHATLLKLGKRLAVGEVMLTSEGEPDPVAHVTATYSIPPGSAEPEA
jgi:uncharacterized protein (TIGR00369 family)